MLSGDRDQDTICAVSTPHGVGGISVIRISGPQSLKIVSQIAGFLPISPKSHQSYFGPLKDSTDQSLVDEVLIAYFKKGHSFTGEETLEISCHGNPQICQSILNLLIKHGSRSADRGEFTYRAFMNGQVDLVQAESVLALIESQSKQSSQLALRQLKGDLSKKLEDIESTMTWILALAEVGIDFSTEDIQVIDKSLVSNKLLSVKTSLNELVASFKIGRIIKDGFRVVLSGVPNVGKSSLLNIFLQEQRAIVTSVPGTTRDIVLGDTLFEGIKFTFLDTAGLREKPSDLVEKIGIEKSYEALQESDFILFVVDSTTGFTSEQVAILDNLEPANTMILLNKSDLQTLSKNELIKQIEASKFYQKHQKSGLSIESLFHFVSALDKTSRESVLKILVDKMGPIRTENTVLLSNARHFERLSKALENTEKAYNLVLSGAGEEFLAIELKEALVAVQETLGKRFDDQVMDRVFKEFCIGK